ncbi:MAG: hypothetical protein HYZ47_03230 [Simkania negevensis]|nr:hypothetical protein [Simkania negevensis]
MAIYDIFEHVEKKRDAEEFAPSSTDIHRHFSEIQFSGEKEGNFENAKGGLFSSIAARLFFFMLFVVDILWGFLSVALFTFFFVLNLLTLFKMYRLKKRFLRYCLSIKRAFVCGISLFVALFSPALGTMFACTYFLMYDKKGIEEIVPSVLQDQFKEFFS